MRNVKTNQCIDKTELQLVFISSYFDGPIEGLVKYRGQIVRFVAEPETLFTENVRYRIEQLSQEELQYELEQKALFEREVGTHWSFDELTGQPLPRWLADVERTNAYFDSQKKLQKKLFPPSIVLGWSIGVT